MRSCLLSAALIVLVSTAALAQSAAGLAGISGVVRDASDASIGNAKIVVSNQAKGIVRTLYSNASGVFTAPALPPAAEYMVTVTATGFANWEVKGIELQVGQNLDLNVGLQVASSATAIASPTICMQPRSLTSLPTYAVSARSNA